MFARAHSISFLNQNRNNGKQQTRNFLFSLFVVFFLFLLRSFFRLLNALQTLFYWIIEQNAQKVRKREEARAHAKESLTAWLSSLRDSIPWNFQNNFFFVFWIFLTLHVEMKWRAFSLFPQKLRCYSDVLDASTVYLYVASKPKRKWFFYTFYFHFLDTNEPGKIDHANLSHRIQMICFLLFSAMTVTLMLLAHTKWLPWADFHPDENFDSAKLMNIHELLNKNAIAHTRSYGLCCKIAKIIFVSEW